MIATTTLVGDVLRSIAGENVSVEVLLPVGMDPHSFQPSPKDVTRVTRADLIFINGAGLEEFLNPMLENAGSQAQIVPVSEGIPLLESEDQHSDEEPASQEGIQGDPHTWFDPNNVLVWVDHIEQALSSADPENASLYAANAEKYRAQLRDLDAWIRAQVEQVPEANRLLVTDHTSFTYFANRYGFRQVGAVIPGYSTLSEPSAQELASLEDTIHSLGVKAVFVGETLNPAVSQHVASDTGIHLVKLYNGSLSEPDGPAGTYLDFMRFNVNAIVEALK